MNTRILCAFLTLTATAFAADENKSTSDRIKETTSDAVEATKEGAKRASDSITETSRDAWKKTKAYLSEDPTTFHESAAKRLNELGAEIKRLKEQGAAFKDRAYYTARIEVLDKHHKYAESQLADLPRDEVKKGETKRSRLDNTIERLEEHIDLTRKESKDFSLAQ